MVVILGVGVDVAVVPAALVSPVVPVVVGTVCSPPIADRGVGTWDYLEPGITWNLGLLSRDEHRRLLGAELLDDVVRASERERGQGQRDVRRRHRGHAAPAGQEEVLVV